MGQTRRRGTRPDFKPDWEPFSLPEDEVLRRGGTLVLPAEGAVVDLVRRDRRVGALVIVPATDRPILKTTRMAIAATAHALANAR